MKFFLTSFASYFLSSAISFGQFSHEQETKYVDGFVSDSLQGPVYIYDLKNGVVIDSVAPSAIGEDCYLMVLIKQMDGDWMQIEAIRHAPCPSDSTLNKLSGKWIYKTDLYFDLSTLDEQTINVYKTASKKSVLTTFSGYERVKIIATAGSWAKVEFTKDGVKMSGWIERYDQCSYRWTACNWDTYQPQPLD